MPLNRADLDAIRSLVREELQRVVGPNSRASSCIGGASDDDALDDDEGDPLGHAALMREMVRADIAHFRGEPGSDKQARIATARYRSKFDESWRRRARKTLGQRADAPVSEEDMLRAMRFWDEAKAARAKAKKRSTNG